MSHTSAQTTTVTSQKITYDQLAALEPELNELLERAENHPGNCANQGWYGKDGIRAAMTLTVGHRRILGPEELRTSAAYDICYKHLYSALPDCNGCGCLTLEDLL
jgi:hypothetical protein